MFPSYDDREESHIANLVMDPGKLGICKSHQPAVGEHRYDCDNVEHVLPYTNTACFLSKRTAPSSAELVCIKPHAHEIVEKAYQGRDRHDHAKTGNVSKLHDSLDVLWKAVVRRKCYLVPSNVLRLVKQQACIDQLNANFLKLFVAGRR